MGMDKQEHCWKEREMHIIGGDLFCCVHTVQQLEEMMVAMIILEKLEVMFIVDKLPRGYAQQGLSTSHPGIHGPGEGGARCCLHPSFLGRKTQWYSPAFWFPRVVPLFIV